MTNEAQLKRYRISCRSTLIAPNNKQLEQTKWGPLLTLTLGNLLLFRQARSSRLAPWPNIVGDTALHNKMPPLSQSR